MIQSDPQRLNRRPASKATARRTNFRPMT